MATVLNVAKYLHSQYVKIYDHDVSFVIKTMLPKLFMKGKTVHFSLLLSYKSLQPYILCVRLRFTMQIISKFETNTINFSHCTYVYSTYVGRVTHYTKGFLRTLELQTRTL